MPRKSTEARTKLKELTAKINAKHQQCQAEPTQALLYGCTIGNLLLLVKSMLPGTEWQRWLKECCSFSVASAQTYMAIAVGDSHLPFTQKTSQYVLEKQEENCHQLAAEKEVDEVVIATALVVEETNNKLDNNGISAMVEKTRDRSGNSADMLIAIEAEEGELYSKIEKTKSRGRSKNSTAKAEEKSGKYLLEQPEDNSRKSVSQKNKKNQGQDLVEAKSNNLVFYIPGNVVPKARPRVTSKGTYLPQRYRKWRNMAEVELCRQVLDMNLKEQLPIAKAAISLSFCGKHRTNSDLDNMAGACLDALTLNGAGVLKDDRLSCIPQLNVEYIADRQETGVWITIEPIVNC